MSGHGAPRIACQCILIALNDPKLIWGRDNSPEKAPLEAKTAVAFVHCGDYRKFNLVDKQFAVTIAAVSFEGLWRDVDHGCEGVGGILARLRA
jgi:hypothetical protein